MGLMPHFSPLLFSTTPVESLPHAFWDDEPLMFADATKPAVVILNVLTFRVSRKPKDLLSHLRRIYFCYQQTLSEPLYAALLDFLIVLNGKGRTLSLRMISGCRSLLDVRQLAAVKRAIEHPEQEAGNRYSLFTSGIIGSRCLLEVSRTQQDSYDVLALANDFIEFSQLDEAMSILEKGLEKQPEQQDWQYALLELYRSTESKQRFAQCYQAMKESGTSLLDDWQALDEIFNGTDL